MALLWFTSFGHQVLSQAGGGGVTTGLVDRKWFDNIVGTPTIDTGVAPPGSPASLLVAGSSAAATNAQRAISDTTFAYGHWYRKSGGVPGGAQRVSNSSPTICGARLNASGDVEIVANNTAAVTLFTPLDNVWYWLSFSVDTSTGTAATAARAYDIWGTQLASQSTSSAVASATQTALIFGVNALNTAPGCDQWYGCPVAGDALADHPFVRYGARLLKVDATGTHSFTAGDFQNAASSNLATNETTSWQDISEVPPNTTAFVKQVVIRTTGYLEYTFEDYSAAPHLGAPAMVQLLAALHPVGAQTANTVTFRLNDGGTITAETAIDTSTATDTLEYRQHGYVTRPNGGTAWDATSVNALRGRFGYSGDATPPPALDAFYLEVLAPVSYTPSFPPPRRDSQRLNVLLRR